jgi:hypothetical protein
LRALIKQVSKGLGIPNQFYLLIAQSKDPFHSNSNQLKRQFLSNFHEIFHYFKPKTQFICLKMNLILAMK